MYYLKLNTKVIPKKNVYIPNNSLDSVKKAIRLITNNKFPSLYYKNNKGFYYDKEYKMIIGFNIIKK
jgi:hypothetical protein